MKQIVELENQFWRQLGGTRRNWKPVLFFFTIGINSRHERFIFNENKEIFIFLICLSEANDSLLALVFFANQASVHRNCVFTKK